MPKQQSAPKPEIRLTPSEVYAIFITSRQAMGVTARTLGFYTDKLKPFIDWCEAHGAPTIGAVTADHIRRYLVHSKNATYPPGQFTALHEQSRACYGSLLLMG